MSSNGSFDRRLAAWLEMDSDGRVQDHIAEILVQTRAIPQRRAWSSLERWLPMTTLVRERFAVSRRTLALLVLALVSITLAAALVAGVGRRDPLTLVPASNGRIVFSNGRAIVRTAADGTDPKTLVVPPDGAHGLAISADGSLLAYVPHGSSPRIEIVATEDPRVGLPPGPTVITAPGMEGYDGPAWSPGGDRVVLLGSLDGPVDDDHLFVARADGSDVSELGAGVIDQAALSRPAWSPDGQWIAFAGRTGDADRWSLFVIHPDGSGYERLATSPLAIDDGGGIAWSPDPAVQRVAYVTAGGIAVFDLARNAEFGTLDGLWPTWSPGGDRIAHWRDGTIVSATSLVLEGSGVSSRPFPAFSGSCQDHPELARKVFCGPATWSPDGTRLIAVDISGEVLLSLRSDGSGEPVIIDLAVTTDVEPDVVWQPIRP